MSNLTFTVKVPTIPVTPEGMEPTARDVKQYRDAAKKIRSNAARGNDISGSILTEAVAALCDAAADALEAYVVSSAQNPSKFAWATGASALHVVKLSEQEYSRVAECGVTLGVDMLFRVDDYRRPPLGMLTTNRTLCEVCTAVADRA